MKSIELPKNIVGSMEEAAASESKNLCQYVMSLHAKNVRDNHYEQYSRETLAHMDRQIKAAH
jgi:hypothetical protein